MKRKINIPTNHSMSPKQFISVLFLFMTLMGYLIIANPERVDFDEYGLAVHSFTSEIQSNVYDPGFYHLGPFWQMRTFKKTFITIEFIGDATNGGTDTYRSSALSTRTVDGLALTLEISFQYKITKNGIRELYIEYNENYGEQIERVARDVLRDQASAFAGIDFFVNRTNIGNVQEYGLTEELKKIGIEVGSYQLRSIDLPDDFENKIKELENARQDVLIALEKQKEAIIEAETKLLVAQKEAEAEVIRANGSAQAFLIQTKAQAEAVGILLNATGTALYEFATVMGFNSTEMLSYLWIDALLKIGEYGNMIIITENTPILTTIGSNNSTGDP